MAEIQPGNTASRPGCLNRIENLNRTIVRDDFLIPIRPPGMEDNTTREILVDGIPVNDMGPLGRPEVIAFQSDVLGQNIISVQLAGCHVPDGSFQANITCYGGMDVSDRVPTLDQNAAEQFQGIG